MRISQIQVHSFELSNTTHRSSYLSFHNHVLMTANCIQAQCVFHIPKRIDYHSAIPYINDLLMIHYVIDVGIYLAKSMLSSLWLCFCYLCLSVPSFANRQMMD